jgi:hypothetical protein
MMLLSWLTVTDDAILDVVAMRRRKPTYPSIPVRDAAHREERRGQGGALFESGTGASQMRQRARNSSDGKPTMAMAA